ncbi:MAG: GntR family transcriptional regulator [Rhodocyclaceae bacterium]|nr:GntR family transcriptional regulator [Rhodocyclaceae bacterium]MCL4682682.1 GntR family transcriptional regulator [Rhodocyclaceae bacterium]
MVSTIKPLKRPLALSDQVYQTLRAHLRDGTIGAGHPLQEVPLAEKLGVSRTPVREALTRLASEGLLASDGRSFVVPALSLQDVDDIYEVRFLLEPAALRRVAELTTDPAVRAPIDEALAAANAAFKANDADAFREANIRFRNAWKDLVPNRRMVRAIEQYADHMMRIRALTLGDARIRGIVMKGLKRIAAALEAGDGDAAAAAMLDHLGEAKHAFIAATGLDKEP